MRKRLWTDPESSSDVEVTGVTGQAEELGVQVGDVFASISGEGMRGKPQREITAALRAGERPLAVQLLRPSDTPGASTGEHKAPKQQLATAVRRRGIDLERQVWKDYVPSAARNVVELKTPGRTWVFAASTGWVVGALLGAGGLGGSVAAAEDAAAAAAAAAEEELALSAWVGALEQAVLWGKLEASGR